MAVKLNLLVFGLLLVIERSRNQFDHLGRIAAFDADGVNAVNGPVFLGGFKVEEGFVLVVDNAHAIIGGRITGGSVDRAKLVVAAVDFADERVFLYVEQIAHEGANGVGGNIEIVDGHCQHHNIRICFLFAFQKALRAASFCSCAFLLALLRAARLGREFFFAIQ